MIGRLLVAPPKSRDLGVLILAALALGVVVGLLLGRLA